MRLIFIHETSMAFRKQNAKMCLFSLHLGNKKSNLRRYPFLGGGGRAIGNTIFLTYLAEKLDMKSPGIKKHLVPRKNVSDKYYYQWQVQNLINHSGKKG